MDAKLVELLRGRTDYLVGGSDALKSWLDRMGKPQLWKANDIDIYVLVKDECKAIGTAFSGPTFNVCVWDQLNEWARDMPDGTVVKPTYKTERDWMEPSTKRQKLFYDSVVGVRTWIVPGAEQTVQVVVIDDRMIKGLSPDDRLLSAYQKISDIGLAYRIVGEPNSTYSTKVFYPTLASLFPYLGYLPNISHPARHRKYTDRGFVCGTDAIRHPFQMLKRYFSSL